MSLNLSGYVPRITEQTQNLASIPEKRTAALPAVTSEKLSSNSWLPPSDIRSVFGTIQPRKLTRRQRKANRAKSAEVSALRSPTIVMGIQEFDLSLVTSIRNVTINKDYTSVLVQARLDQGVNLSLTLHNKQAEKPGNLEIRSVSIRFEVSDHSPRAHFIVSSLYAMLALAGSVNIALPEMNVEVGTTYSLPLSEISNFLQSRQTYYGLMVIEKATGLRLPIPEYIDAEDMASISFAYYSIVERTFDWLANFITLPVPATQEILSWLDNLNPTEHGRSVYKIVFGPTPAARTIFGQVISLGLETVFIDDAFLPNHDDVREELARLDGHEVPIVFRPLSGMGHYELREAPQLPSQPWDETMRNFIQLEAKLNHRLASRYNTLAFATLRGLDQTEITSLTTPPEIEFSQNHD